jgi:hypothetical protein
LSRNAKKNRPGGVFATGFFNENETTCETPTHKKPPPAYTQHNNFITLCYGVKLKHKNTFTTYFINFTCTEWIPLFEITNSHDLVYKWFTVLKNEMDAAVVAYVNIPNHVHAILHFSKEGFDLNNIISNNKRFMAYEIINQLE